MLNDRFQPLPEAGATQERTLEAVGWKSVLGERHLTGMKINGQTPTTQEVETE